MATKPLISTDAGLQLFKLNLADVTIAGEDAARVAAALVALLAEHSDALGDGYIELTPIHSEDRIAFASAFDGFSFA